MTRADLINEFVYGWTEFAQKQQCLLGQLYQLVCLGEVKRSEGPSGEKPKSRPPTNLDHLDLYTRCNTEVHLVTSIPQYSTMRLEKLRTQARIALGYDAPRMRIDKTVCHVCGSDLEVAVDASSNVECTNESCGNYYDRLDWAAILLCHLDATSEVVGSVDSMGSVLRSSGDSSGEEPSD